MPFVDNKTANALIVGSANALVTGTFDQPIITGRVEIDHGQWMFSGNRYTLLGGSIDFSNPARFEPFFDLTAETDAHAPGQRYHVTVRITGTLDKLGATLNAEPWLSEMQIISLLMGEAPDVGATELRALSATQDEQAKALSSVGLAFIVSPISATVGSAIQKATTREHANRADPEHRVDAAAAEPHGAHRARPQRLEQRVRDLFPHAQRHAERAHSCRVPRRTIASRGSCPATRTRRSRSTSASGTSSDDAACEAA